MEFSRGLAIVLGLLTPIAETIRRWHVWREAPERLFDDYLMGALLLAGAIATRRGADRGRPLLAAAWGFTCALAYSSIFGQLEYIRAGLPDPSGIKPAYVLGIKIAGGLLAVVALVLTLRPSKSPTTDAASRTHPT